MSLLIITIFNPMRFSPIGLLSARQRWDSNPRIPDLQSGPLNQLGYVAIRRVEDSNLYILAECRFSKPVLYQLSQHAIAGRSGHDPESAILETAMHPITPSTHTTTRGLEPPCPSPGWHPALRTGYPFRTLP